MANNRVDPGLIGKRLGASGGSGRGPRDREPEEGPSGGNTLFAVGFVAIFIVGAGALAASDAGAGFRAAFYEEVMGPPPPPPYQSRVAATCDKGWKDVRDNADQMHCYMTTDVGRLCDPLERRALADKWVAYQIADDRLIGSAATAFLTGYGKSGAVDAMKMGIADAKSRDPNLSDEQRGEEMKKAAGLAQDFNAPTMKALEEGSHNKVGIVTLIHDVRDLAEEGYFAASDFAAKIPKDAKDGFAEAHNFAPSPCKKR